MWVVKIACVAIIMGEDAEEVKKGPEDRHGDFLMMFQCRNPFVKNGPSDD